MTVSRKLVVILGPHRSGTSVCAAAVAALGAYMGEQLTYINEENPKGFFELPELVAFNDRLLAELGGAWDNPLFSGKLAIQGRDLGEWRQEAALLLGQALGDRPFVAIKDPRLCQLLDFWQPVFELAGFPAEDVFYIHTLRSVGEVADSAQRRAHKTPQFYDLGSDIREGAALWFSLTAQSLLATEGFNNCYIGYRNLLQNPEQVLLRIAAFLGVEPHSQSLHDFCADFLDSNLNRSKSDAEAEEAIRSALPQALELQSALDPIIGGDSLSPQMNEIRDIANNSGAQGAITSILLPSLSRVLSRATTDRLEASRLAGVVEKLQSQNEDAQQNIEGMKSEFKRNIESVKAEHAQVLAPLRSELEQMQLATASQTEQLHRQAVVTGTLREQLQSARAEFDKQTADFRAAVLHHRETLENLEAENALLRHDSDDAVGELTLAFSMLRRRVRQILRRPWYVVKGRIQHFRKRVKRLWLRFRLKAIEKYHGISLTHPATAWGLRRVLRPFFRGMDFLLDDSPLHALGVSANRVSDPFRFQQILPAENFAPLVSVIVPNYNHCEFLDLRLQSIYSQTYENFEVILLDDASDDGSVDILEKYHKLYPERTTIEFNEQNSGGVFRQWKRGLSLAKGDIIWLAESDDWCSENFLDELVPYFENEAVQVSYARTLFMDRTGEKQVWSIEEYLHDLDPLRWTNAFVETAATIVSEGFAIKNIIPNVSSALFRPPTHLEILDDPNWLKMRTCGDWALYLHLLRGGALAYSPRATNFYRMHGGNTSVSSYAEDEYYREHETVARLVNQYFDAPWGHFERLHENLGVHWRNTRKDFSVAAFEECFSLSRIREAKQRRAPNLLMASYAFCAGGGETFPVSLANIMKAQGYNVTYLDCAQEPRMDGIRQRLRPDIAVVSDFRQLEAIVKAFNIDVVHSHHAWMEGTILNLLPEESRVKLVVTLHGMYETMNDYELKSILPRLAKRISSFIYVADKNLTALRKHRLQDRVPMVRIDNALQVEPYDAIERSTLGIANDAFVLTLVSRGMPEKGWVEGMAAVKRAREISHRDIQLLLVGDGPEYERLADKKLPEYVRLMGFQRNVRGFFGVADIGFLPSKFRGESFPLVIIECLQVGRPFLASDLGEIRHMLKGKTALAGSVVPLQGDSVDIGALSEEIARLATDKRYYESAVEVVREVSPRFDPALMAQKHDAVYRNLISDSDALAQASG